MECMVDLVPIMESTDLRDNTGRCRHDCTCL